MRDYVLLHLSFMVYALSSVCSKFAGLSSERGLLSMEFAFYYGTAILLLGVFTLGWQKVLTTIPLSVAYSNKGILLLWGMFLGNLIFDEEITTKNILAIMMVMSGIYLCSGRRERDGK